MAFAGVRKWIVIKFIKSLLGDVAKGEYGMSLKSVWDWANGRKQAIGLLITFLVMLQAQLPELLKAFDAGDDLAVTVGKVLGEAVVVVGAFHKVLKGS